MLNFSCNTLEMNKHCYFGSYESSFTIEVWFTTTVSAPGNLLSKSRHYNFTLLGARYSCVPINIHELSSWMQSCYLQQIDLFGSCFKLFESGPD